jgi:hypothetical protein
MLRHIGGGSSLGVDKLQRYIPGAPASWSLGKRASKEVSSVRVVWALQVSKIKEAALRSSSEQATGRHPPQILSPCSTSPLGGLLWSLLLSCRQATTGGGTVGLFTAVLNAPKGTFWGARVTIAVAGCPAFSQEMILQAPTCIGTSDFFKTGPMAGSWDEAAWAAKGLPTLGKVKITGTVSKAAHCS